MRAPRFLWPLALVTVACATAKVPPMPVEKVRLPGGEALAFSEGGDPNGRRVIYVHGTPGDRDAWRDYVAHPVPGTESIAVDRLGFGDSDPGEADAKAVPSFEAQADSIAPLLKEQGGGWPILVGHSLGGPIACRIAADHPDEVGGLVLLAPSVDPDLERWRWFNRLAAMKLVHGMLGSSLRVSNDEVRAAKEEEEKLAPLLSKIRCPVVIVHGTKDDLVPYANVAYAVKELTGASSVRVVTIEGAGHFLPWKHEPEVRKAIESAVAGAEAKP